MSELANSIVDCGEIGVLVIAAVAVGLPLVHRHRSLAIAWGLSLAICIIVVTGAKLSHFLIPDISGHAAVTVGFYLGLTAIMLKLAPRRLAVAAGLVLASMAAAICWSVWALHWHSALNVVAGALLGLACPATVALVPASRQSHAYEAMALLAVAALVIIVLHGLRLDYIERAQAAFIAL
jgi:hypothetical protein